MSNENKGKQIVVVESGWVFLAEDVVDVEVGLYPTGCWKLLNASVIRSWGTTAGLGEIAITTYQANIAPEDFYFSSISDLIDLTFDKINEDFEIRYDIYPVTLIKGVREIKYLVAFHSSINYETPENEGSLIITPRMNAFYAIMGFYYRPTMVVDDKDSFDCLWALKKPVQIGKEGISELCFHLC